MLAKQPTAVVLLGVVLDVTAVLMDEQVFTEAVNGPVKFELLAAIVVFGGGRKNFDDEERIENVVLLVSKQLGFAPNDAAIGICVGPARSNFDPQARVEDAATGRNLAVEQRADTIRQQRVIQGTAGHGEHLAIVELAFGLGLALEAQVLVLGERRRWLDMYYCASKARTVCTRTLAPFSMSCGRENSFGEWLIPPILGTKIMPIGPMRAIS